MAPVSFHFVALNENTSEASLVSAIQALPTSEKPYYVGKCHHWIHGPELSSTSLTWNGDIARKWDYFMFRKSSSPESLELPDGLSELVMDVWTINGEVDDSQLDGYTEIRYVNQRV